MKVIEVVESRVWVHVSGRRTSVHGSCPWTSDRERKDWALQTQGYTWHLDNGTIGLGRVPAKTREEAEEVMRKVNSLGR